MGVSKNRGVSPKWMVKIMENPIKMDDLGGNPLFSETSIWGFFHIVIFFHMFKDSVSCPTSWDRLYSKISDMFVSPQRGPKQRESGIFWILIFDSAT